MSFENPRISAEEKKLNQAVFETFPAEARYGIRSALREIQTGKDAPPNRSRTVGEVVDLLRGDISTIESELAGGDTRYRLADFSEMGQRSDVEAQQARGKFLQESLMNAKAALVALEGFDPSEVPQI